MAKKSKIVKNEKRLEIVLRYQDKVRELRAKGDYEGLSKAACTHLLRSRE